MSLILAIEPDRRQASRVGALGRRIQGAELVVADSTQQAIGMLNGRVPDLILTSLLLSPREEARLPELNKSGPPVQTLVIPVLGSGSKGAGRSSGGFLNKLRKSPNGQREAGCDPAMFAAQVVQYLRRLETDREERQEQAVSRVNQPVGEPLVETSEVSLPPPPEPAYLAAAMKPLPEEPPLSVDVEDNVPADGEEPIRLQAVDPELNTPAAMNAAAPSSKVIWEAILLDDDDHMLAPIELTNEPIDLETFVSELEAEAARIHAQGTAKPVVKPAAPPTDPIIYEFVEALAETNGIEPVGTVEDELWSPLPVSVERVWPPLQVGGAAIEDAKAVPLAIEVDLTSMNRAKPIQDEWGFFDPDRCGFNALLAKLEELTK